MKASCYHCSDEIVGRAILFDDRQFCCSGCKQVYQLLSEHNLGEFYSLENKPGTKPNGADDFRYAFLEVPEIRSKFIDFENEEQTLVSLYLPSIHCSSCIYLLENLHKIDEAIYSCQVDFSKRLASILFDHRKLSLEKLALLLEKIGYSPNFSAQKDIKRKKDLSYLYKLGVAGFAFGSIMLWTFPEYLGVSEDNLVFRNFTSYLSFAISLPVLFYSANAYLISAFRALRYRSINIDVPISIGILALYFQSSYSIFTNNGPGYMDSFAAFIFFLLIGKWFQSKTYDTLAFDRDYSSYFPVAVTRIRTNTIEIIEIDQLTSGDQIRIRNEEVIPCDSTLSSDSCYIDYSFVTGESELIKKKAGDFIYAGGRIKGSAVDLTVVKESSRSHLTQLWNKTGNKKKQGSEEDKFSLYFLIALLSIAAIAAIYYLLRDSSRTIEIVVSILIVACPCALALSRPFTYGNIMRKMGKGGLYLKNVKVIPALHEISDIVFDKTGTITESDNLKVTYIGEKLTSEHKEILHALVKNSTHPLSRAIYHYLDQIDGSLSVHNFEEHRGQGIQARINDNLVALGSASFVGVSQPNSVSRSSSYFSIKGKIVGHFVFESRLRPGIEETIRELKSRYHIHILSGDNEKEKMRFLHFVQDDKNLVFGCSPQDKAHYIENLQTQGKKVLMIGDGLNDTGALDAAHVGMAVSEDVFRFTPNSDAIIDAHKLINIQKFLNLSAYARTILFTCFGFSLAYNLIGLSFAISGNLTPLVAAVLMPISSISVVFISTFGSLLKRS